jgi:hypothetical protein
MAIQSGGGDADMACLLSLGHQRIWRCCLLSRVLLACLTFSNTTLALCFVFITVGLTTKLTTWLHGIVFLEMLTVTQPVRTLPAYEDVSKSFRTGRLEQELQMVQLSATKCSCIAILCISLASFAAITICVASQRVFIVVSVYFVIDSIRKLLDTPSYMGT